MLRTSCAISATVTPLSPSAANVATTLSTRFCSTCTNYGKLSSSSIVCSFQSNLGQMFNSRPHSIHVACQIRTLGLNNNQQNTTQNKTKHKNKTKTNEPHAANTGKHKQQNKTTTKNPKRTPPNDSD